MDHRQRHASQTNAGQAEAGQAEAGPQDARHPEAGDLDAGAYIGSEPELASETIPGGVQDEDERVAANASQRGVSGLDFLDEGTSDGEGQGR